MRNVVVALLVAALAAAGCGCAPPTPASGPDISGCPWGYVGGTIVARAKTEVKGTEDDPVYLTERYSLEAYRFRVPNGRYTVRLHVAETYEPSKASRFSRTSIHSRRRAPSSRPSSRSARPTSRTAS